MGDLDFVILGDAIWVDFVNTARGTGPVLDRLRSMEAWKRWIDLEKLPADQGTMELSEILEFRDRLSALAQSLARERQAPSTSIHAINGVLAHTTGYHQLTRVRGTWRSVFTPSHPVTPIDAIARSAAATLSDPAAIVGQCSGAACTLYFIDISANHSRRWCSSTTCGKQHRVERRRTVR
ncbi:MAG: CGNR zinc finger domain-containing protein [Gemmatimonadota bacterium]